MDRSLQKQVAQMYPKKQFKAPRTPLQQALNNPVHNDRRESFYPPLETGNKVSPRARKILIVIICTFLAAVIFSSFAYTISDGIANKLNIELFDETGNPGMSIMIIHLLILAVLIYLVLSGGGY